MSQSIFPKLPGESWPVVKRPTHSTQIQTSVSGMEVRVAQYSNPRYVWEVPFDWLPADTGQAYYQSLLGFYNAMHGAWDSFLFDDVTDNLVTGQAIGTGNGSTLGFQLVRSIGTAQEPLYNFKTGSDAPKIYLAGTLQTSGYTITSGLLTFASAPGSGVAITATLKYYWRVRFVEDSLDFSNWAQDLWEAKRVSLISVRG